MLGANVKVKETHIKMIICIVGKVSAGETKLSFSTRIQSCVSAMLWFLKCISECAKELSGKQHVLKEERVKK